ncbi:MAG: alpha/beta hydrolase [Chloroflexi bacterium]|nr:alpha/beta hydrolase [Chloroflexota bacterium]
MDIPTMEGVTAQTVTTDRLTTRVLFAGPEEGTPVLFLHGNASNATFWEEVMLALPEGFRGIAPDQRGYGGADPEKKVDATNGMGDLADDAIALLDHLGIDKVHLAGHSMGGSVIWRILSDYPGRVLTVTVAAPGSPFGFGGSKDLEGTPNFPDGAGSGAGIVNAEFTQRMAAGDRSEENPQSAPRVIMNTFYWKPPFKPEREEELLSALLSEHVGEKEYPGDFTPSENWPGAAPGKFGPANALAPIYVADISKLYAVDPKPHILWIRGAEDQIVSDGSMFDLGTLGKLGAVPGWPGEEVFPSQPMVSQTRAVLEKYAEAGGSFEEVVFEDCGHTPFIEKPDAFNEKFHALLTQ